MADNKLDIKAFLDKDEQKDLLRLLIFRRLMELAVFIL